MKTIALSVALIGLSISVASCKQARYEFLGKKKNNNTPQTLGPQPVPTPVDPGFSFIISADPTTQRVGLPINFTGTGCGLNNDGVIDWQFGDGLAGQGARVAHPYKYKGNFVVDATCTTIDGKKLTAQVRITILAPSCSNPCGSPGQNPGQTQQG